MIVNGGKQTMKCFNEEMNCFFNCNGLLFIIFDSIFHTDPKFTLPRKLSLVVDNLVPGQSPIIPG